jgi:hypothetical protein
MVSFVTEYVFFINDPSQHNFFLYVYEVLIWSFSKPRHEGKFCYSVHRLPGRACRTGGCTKGFKLDRLHTAQAVMWDFCVDKKFPSNKGTENM